MNATVIRAIKSNKIPEQSRGWASSLDCLRTIAVVLAATCVGACEGAPAAETTLAADVIYNNGHVVTDVLEGREAAAVAVRDGLIIAIGDSVDVLSLASPETKVVDLQGRTVLPGFYDNHNHIGGEKDSRVQDWEHISSKAELLDVLAERASRIPKGEWILGTLQNENMPQAKLPTRWEMDEVTPDNPVTMRRGHITLANSLAMKLADITRDTPTPPGGGIDRNDEGEPIGWFWEGAGRRLVMDAVPPPPPTPDDEAEEAIRAQLVDLLSYGITSVNIPGMRPNTLRWIQNVYRESGDKLPRATVQVRLSPGYDSFDNTDEGVAVSIEELEGLSFVTGFGNDRLRLGAVKMSVDGGFSAAAFNTLEPYPNHDEDYYGVVRIPEDVLYRVSRRAHDLGWQLGIHAIGDGAVQMATDVLARIIAENPRKNHRHYLHHVSVLPPEETLNKLAENDILVASQPNFTYSLGPYNASPALSPERLQTNNPQASLLKHHIRVSYGSDGMPTGPLVGIYAAVTRKGVDGKVYGPEEKVSLRQAIQMYTAAPAYLNFCEDTRGTIEEGKVADMIVLGRDIFSVPPEELMEVPIDMTIVGGQVLYARK